MKTEHFEAIERAKMHGVMPSVLAHELLVRDLVEAAMFEWQNIAAPFSKLNEGQRQEVTDRVTEKVTTAVYTAVGIISSRSVDTIPLTVADAKFKAKSITVTATIDAQDPNRHGLIDVAGKLCLLVLAPNDYAEGLDSLQVERDQREMPLHVSDLTGSLFDGKPAGPDEPDGEPHPLGTAEELAERIATGTQHQAPEMTEGKEFGDYTYDDAAQLIVLKAQKKPFKAHWIQSRLAIDSDKAASLLIRLLDNGVIQLDTEGETAMDHSYKVVATLADVT
ncbi:DNA translocase FtsK [Pseudomonas kielensis]|uniref:DNA translocase FtsK n=1 Tax=Pseudomonas kielensis TaxID=2762577 RepID=UPI00223FBDBD|nr:DNA translocase FtsK [Pseudomonas kielensis]UZM14831.1 DNA translocase FtsK [Pseudomonas kielensis]